MKQFIVDRHTTPNTPTLEQVPTEKIPIYENRAAVEADLANLEEGQLVATPDTGDELAQPVDVVEEGNLHAVSSNAVANIFGASIDNTKFSISTTNTLANYTGIAYINISRQSTDAVVIYEDDKQLLEDDRGSTASYYHPFTVLIRKGHNYKYNAGTLDLLKFIPFNIE